MPPLKKASLTIIEQDGKILLLRRANTSFANGLYTLPSGKVNENETFAFAAIRETKEEVDIDVKEAKSIHIMFEKRPETEWIHHFFIATKWQGLPKNNEPHKCDDVNWFEINNLPKNLIPFVKTALKKIYKEKSHFSEI